MDIKSLQIKFWYHCIAHEIAKHTSNKNEVSAYKLEDIQLTNHEKNTKIKNYFSNRWYRYQKGINMPNANFIAKIEQKVKGSSSLINNPLWEVLKVLETSKDHTKLVSNIDLTLFNAKTRKTILIANNKLKDYNGSIGWHLSKRNSFDSIAALILFIFQIKDKIKFADLQILTLKFHSKVRGRKELLEEQLSKIVYYISQVLLLLGMRYFDHPAFPLLKIAYDFIYQNLLKNILLPNNEMFSYKNITNFTDTLLSINRVQHLAPKDMPSLLRYNYILSRLPSWSNIKLKDIFITEKKPFS